MSEEEIKSHTPIKDLASAMCATNGNGGEDGFVPTTDVELTHEIVQTLFNDDNLNMITSLSKRELSGVMKIHVINDIMHQGDESVLTRMLWNYKSLKVSENRLGRKELIQAIIGRQSEDEGSGGFINKFIR